MKEVAIGIGAVLALTTLVLWSNGLSLMVKRTFGLASADADREIFEHSHSYLEGMIRDLQHLAAQYTVATPEQKIGLRALALHRFDGFPLGELPMDLQQFYQKLRADEEQQ